MSEQSGEILNAPSSEIPKVGKAKPSKVLPTDRLSFDKQLNTLRGYAAASGIDRKAVSNREVGVIVQIHENTISICNPFFQDIGLLFKEGQKNRPSDEVGDYSQAFEWDGDKAAQKLALVLRKAWFSVALIPKLTFRPLTKDEAISFLANEAKAPKEYKAQLELILEYLKVAGIIQYDGATVTLGPTARDSVENGGVHNRQANQNVEITPQAGALNMQSAAIKSDLHPFIQGLIDKLPLPDSDWPLIDRARGLTTAANSFDLMYKDDDLVGIGVAVEGSTLSVKKGTT